MRVPILIPRVPNAQALVPYLERIDHGKRFSNFGPLENELRFRMAEYLGCRIENVATVTNATLAIQGLASTSLISSPSWAVPSWTFLASAYAIKNAGLGISFRDVGSDWRAEFQPEDKHLLDVLPFGDEMRPSGIPGDRTIIVDAAASFPTLLNVFSTVRDQQKIAIVISLHATKLLPAGEGAVVASLDTSWIERLKRWTNFGFDTTRNSGSLGTNAKMSEYSAAVGLAALDEWPRTKALLESKLESALEISSHFGLATHPAMSKKFVTPYWILQTPSHHFKNKLISIAQKMAIETRDWWGAGCHRISTFSNDGEISLPKTEHLARTTIGLPFHSFLTSEDFKIISQLIKETFAQNEN